MRGLLEDFLFDELHGPAEFLLKAVRRNSVDRGRPTVRCYAETGEKRLPAFRREGFIFHGRNIPARAEGGDLVRQRLRHGFVTSPLPEFAVERSKRIKCALEITYTFVVRMHDSIVLRSLGRELLGDRKQRQ